MRARILRNVRRVVRRSRYRRTPLSRKIQDAQHEAAHVVVGLALGLRLSRATVKREGDTLGYVEFQKGAREAELITWAVGVAWERRFGDLEHAAGDLALLRAARVRGVARLRALERAAWCVLESRAGVHERVTRALLEDDVTPATLARLVAEPSTRRSLARGSRSLARRVRRR
jgi:hypothetical protein